jgi:hypothetical protein
VLGYVPFKVDGYCRDCKRQTTYSATSKYGNRMMPMPDEKCDELKIWKGIVNLELCCARNSDHKILFFVNAGEGTIEKIGQLPSLASISNDEASGYRKILQEDYAKEFHKAIGLAAHGVGIGSFVYLRRVFEGLIYRRFNEFKTNEGWADEDFFSKKMEEKIQFLKGHLPESLVTNRKIYSILSLVIHELEEEKCLEYFEIMKSSTIIILEEDKKRWKNWHYTRVSRKQFPNLIIRNNISAVAA